MASRLARGELVSLTIPALANLFKSMRVISTFCDPSFCDEVVPYHYLLGWAHMYWAGLYVPTMDDSLLHHLPTLAQIAGARASRVPSWRARMYFRQGESFLRLCGGRRFACSADQVQTEDLVLSDRGSEGEVRGPLRLGSSEAGFLVSLRHGLLPLRLGDLVVLEPYMPHRCAHQLGLDQCIPADITSFRGICADLVGVVRCWETFLRIETEARFMIPKTHRSATFTIPYRRWYRDMVYICEIHQLPRWMEWVLPQPGDHLSVRPVPPLEIVPNIRSRDSRAFNINLCF